MGAVLPGDAGDQCDSVASHTAGLAKRKQFSRRLLRNQCCSLPRPSVLPFPQRFPMLRLLTVLSLTLAVATLWPALPITLANGSSSYSQNNGKKSNSQDNGKSSYSQANSKKSNSKDKGNNSYSQGKNDGWKGKKEFAKNSRKGPKRPGHGHGGQHPPSMHPRSPKSNCACDHGAFPPKSPCSNGNGPKDRGPKWAKDRDDRDRDDDDRGRDSKDKDPKYKEDDRKGPKYKA